MSDLTQTTSSARSGASATFGALAAMLKLGVIEGYTETAATVGRALTYGMIVAVMWSIWRITPLGEAFKSGQSYSMEQLVWYVALTELIIFSTAHLFREVQDEIRSGALTCQIVRPVAWPLLTITRWYGRFLAQLSLLAIVGSVVSLVLTKGAWVIPLSSLPLLVPMLLLAGLLGTMGQFAVGVACLWAGKSEPVYWIWQKSVFVLGGLLIPLGFYPELLQSIAWATPFPAMLHVPAMTALGTDANALWLALGNQVLWAVLFSLASWLLWRGTLKRIGKIGD
ncbi:MAG: ABC-2 family transporter protein [Alphaproteobacteria bacterium]